MAKPFLKWVGGKASILPELIKRVPETYGTYWEPFVGGGALFFALAPAKAVLSDTNRKLMYAFEAVKNKPEETMEQLQLLQDNHDADLYHRTVEMYNRIDLQNDAYGMLFIYLNKTCFNGLYRENKSGGFNVPIGKYSVCKVFDKEVITECSKVLQTAELRHGNFLQQSEKDFVKDDFYYLDPPYYKSYNGYSASLFGEYEHFKLYLKCKALDAAGCKFMMSNSDEPLIRDLYRDFNIETVESRRSVSCKGEGRTRKQELIIRNYGKEENKEAE